MIILGIDPGYAIVGWGVLEYKMNKFRVLGYGAITTEAHTDFPLRLQTIYNDMCYLFEKYKPEVMSMEKLFYNNNAKTVIDVAQARELLRFRHKITVWIFLNILRFRLSRLL